MSQELPQDWYFEVGGNRSGPYTVEQILGLLAEKEISLDQKISCSELQGQWITVQQLAESARPKASESTRILGGAGFQPPPRPDKPERTLTGITAPGSGPAGEASDPTLALFEALRTTRERKMEGQLPSRAKMMEDAAHWGMLARSERKVGPKFWLTVAFTQVLGLGVWGITKLIDSKTAELAQQATPQRRIATDSAAPAPTAAAPTPKAAAVRPTPAAPPRSATQPPSRPATPLARPPARPAPVFSPRPRPEIRPMPRDERRDDPADRRDDPRDERRDDRRDDRKDDLSQDLKIRRDPQNQPHSQPADDPRPSEVRFEGYPSQLPPNDPQQNDPSHQQNSGGSRDGTGMNPGAPSQAPYSNSGGEDPALRDPRETNQPVN